MFKLEAILADNLRNNNIETRTVLVLQINDRKRLTNINSFLIENLPLTTFSLTHLKRIKSNRDKCEIIIAPVPDDSGNDIILSKNFLKTISDHEKVTNFLNQFDTLNFQICRVPSCAPLTRFQFENASIFWPVNFHENKYLTKCLNSTLFSTDELKIIYNLMQDTLNLLKKNDLNVHLNGKLCSMNPCFKMAALIVRDNRCQVVTSGLSDSDSNPTNHAAIVAIENIATLQRKIRDNGTEGLSPELVEKCQDDYLCTNYDCFLSQEPCLMCAMALVHSRVKRVFFFTDPDRAVCEECNDQAYTVHQLHILPNLNHHYEVWKITPNVSLQQPNSPKKNEFPSKRPKLSS